MRLAIPSSFLALLLSQPLAAADWPEAGADSSRSAKAAEELKGPLGQLWSMETGRPAPSFPEAGRSDFWRNQVGTLKSRTIFDLAPQPVLAAGRLYLCGSHDDALRCLDAATGKELWRFTAEGPLRCAPLLADGKVYFGGDDGWLRCLDAASGELVWETAPPSPDLIIGNGRFISLHAIRCGLIRVGGKFCAGSGLFPGEACRWFSFDPKTGKILDERKLDAPAQGYPVLRNGEAFLPTGNDAKGRTEKIDGAAPGDKEATPPKGACAVVHVGSRRFIGRAGGVAEIDARDKEIWSASMRGSVRGLAFSDGRLIAVSDSGQVSAFGPKGRSVVKTKTAELPPPEMADAIPSSYTLVLPGCDPVAANKLLPSGGRGIFLAADAEGERRLRPALSPAASLIRQRGAALPAFRKGSFDLVVAPAASPELLALLVPGSGRLVNAQGAELGRKPVAEGVGSWSGLYADAGNSGCSQDRLAGTDLVPQWFGAPGPAAMIDRHLRAQPAVAGGGLMLIPGHEEIFCLNAWNGALLWRRKFPDFARVAALRDSSALALAGGRLALASGGKALLIDARSGKSEKSFSAGGGDWDYIAWHQGALYGSSAEKGAIRRKAEKAVIYDGGYTDNQKNILSTSLFAFAADGRALWRRSSKGAIPTPSICLLGGRLFCIEAGVKVDEGKKAFKGRAAISSIAAARPHLLALDAKTGKEIFRLPVEIPATAQTCYLLGGPGEGGPVLLSTSFNEGGKVRYRLVAYSRAEGKELWRQQVDTGFDPNMEHGEQDRHPLVIGDLVFAEPAFFNLNDGKPSPGPAFSRGYGCGNASASATALFFRSGGLGVCDLSARKTLSINPASRAGCWINMIPADGLLLVPEASSGCICNFALQSSMAFAPR
ncbi:MAG: Serine/threonine-protein kinase AfsK [Verrucomicrobiota bacterium]|jgi:outer membrane protein assembly factor BamB